MITLEQLKQSSDQIKKTRPTYEPILDFYGRVFIAQEQSRQDIVLSPIVIEPDLLRIKQDNDLPLIDPSEFLIDLPAARRLFDTICDLAVKFAPELASSAHTLKTILPSSSVDLEALFSAILDNKDATLQDLAGRLNVPERDLVFLGYAGIAPSIQVCAEQLVPCLTIMPELRKGYCPICGNHPDLAFLDTDGKRHLKCCFCAHEWETKRMGCIFCENNDPELQHYFFTDEEKEYRVNLCDHCHQYIKVVDLRQMDRAFYPRLEQIATLHLDMKAREKGYTDPGALTNEESIE